MTTEKQDRGSGRELPDCVDTAPVRRWLTSMEAEGRGADAWARVELWRQMVAEHEVVRTRVEGRVGIVEMAYPPKANAIVPPMYKLLAEAVDGFAADDEVWVVVITGAGEVFSTGGYVGRDAFYAGLDAGHDGAKGEPIRRTLWEMFQPVSEAIFSCEKPTIAAVNGLVMAEALDIALSADLRVGHPGTEFRFSFAATGNTAYTGTAWSLPRLIGLAAAKRLLLTAEQVGGEAAHDLGLLSFLYPEESFWEETMALAHRFESLPPITQRLIKKELHLGMGIGDFRSALETFSMIEPIVQSTDDHMDAENAVIEKRAPVVLGH